MPREYRSPVHKLSSIMRRSGRRAPHSSNDQPREADNVVALIPGTSLWFEQVWSNIEDDQPLTRGEWERLLDFARTAYYRSGRHQESFVTEPLLAIMRAFRAFLKLRNNLHTGPFATDDRYICSFAGFLNRPEITHTNSWKVDVIDLLTDVIEHLESSNTTRVNASYLVELFLGALVEEPPVPDMFLNQALVPYTISIFQAAARGYSLSEQEGRRSWVFALAKSRTQLGESFRSYGTPVDFEHNGRRLQVLPNSHDTGAILWLKSNTVRVALGTITLHRWVDAFVHGVVVKDFTPLDDGFVANLDAVQLDLSADDVVSLTHLFEQYMQSEALSEQRDRMLFQWGRI